MELITAIAMICQVNAGVGTGVRYESPMSESIDRIYVKQRNCQKRIAKCMLEKDILSIYYIFYMD
jgi:hypothetical protein